MNIIELQDRLKDLPDRALMQEMQMPTGNMPQFLVLSELTRRRRMRDEYNRQMAADMPTVAEEVMTAAGAPQGGITAIARNMTPNSSIAQNTGEDMAVQREPTRMPQKMSDGGIVRMANGGFPNRMDLAAQIMRTVNPRARSIYDDVNALPRETLISIYGIDAVREAESMLLPFEKKSMGEIPLGLSSSFNESQLRKMERQGIFGNKSYRDPLQSTYLGGESIGNVSADVEDFAPTIDFNASDRGFEPTNIAPIAAMSEVPVRSADALNFDDSVPNKLRSIQGMKQFDEITPASNIDAAQQISYQSGKEPFRRFGANYYNALMSAQGNEMKGDRDRIMATAGEIFPFYLEKINEQFNTPSSSVVASEPELSMDELMAQAQIEREGFGAGQTDDTSGITTESRRADREKKGFIDFLPTFGSTGEGRGRDYQVTMGDFLEIPKNIEELMPPINQETEDRQVRKSSSVIDNLIDEGFTGGDIDPSDVPTQTTGTPLEIPSEEEGGVESLLPTLLGDDDSGTTGNVGSGTPSGGDAYTKLESRIAKMLDDREKSAESDKFLALAQAGLALMASDSPTLGGAIGEAGLVGISQLREARNQYDKDILGLLSTQADIDAARSDAALEKRRLDLEEKELNRTGMKPGDLLDYLAALNKQQTTLTKQLSENLIEDSDDVRNRIILNELEIERVKRQLGYGSSTKDLAD